MSKSTRKPFGRNRAIKADLRRLHSEARDELRKARLVHADITSLLVNLKALTLAGLKGWRYWWQGLKLLRAIKSEQRTIIGGV